MGRSPADHAEDEAFEQEVVRIARAIYSPTRPYQGATVIGGRERDAVIEGDEVVVAIEATTSRTVEKASKDGTKLKELCDRLATRHKFKAIKGFFVTRDDTTAQQRDVIRGVGGPITACSLAQFRAQLIDSRDYLECRQMYPFGSARNPDTGSATELERYVPLGFSAVQNSQSPRATLGLADIVERIAEGDATLLLGDFGAGKSMTLREVHRELAKRHFKDALAPFPVTLNLRDHQGQKDTDEALRRHAARIGFESATKLVRAWRAGQVHVLLDGFDEIAASGWRGRTPDLPLIRRGSVELVRRFTEETPPSAGLLISGRRHFFDSDAEMTASLGVRDRRPIVLHTDDFNDDQVRAYLSERSWTGQLPDWLPSHPLLLGHLASAGALGALTEGALPEPAPGWEYLLDRICEREAKIEQGLDGRTIRRVLERLATIARGRGGGQGPVLPSDLSQAFEEIAGYPPDEGSFQVLQRLPGLGVQDATDGARAFIDASLLDAARAGDVVRYAAGQDDSLGNISVASVPLSRLGVLVATLQAERLSVTPGQCNASAKKLQTRGDVDAFVLDLVRIGAELGPSKPGVLEFSFLEIESLEMQDTETDFGSLTFRECIVTTLDLTEYDGEAPLPHFDHCHIGTVLGAASATGLPSGRFTDCTFDAFDPSSKTTRGILGMPGLRPGQKVILTVLKKVYLQAGGGRKEEALARGLSPHFRDLVPDAIAYLVGNNLLIESRAGARKIYLPVRGQRGRVRALLESATASSDPVLRTY
ncbi:NACHT domain-containing NTPase [Microbacterium sp. MYb64]|uniref:NACHT domain-containing protein n=1 Tax=Microbacterium sp. MYb64 TaxID=1848691 RepID=UPI000CFE15D5|nr:NACHT domain-containing protein [Microbacterium sp. MYb64]PRB08438.1 hypothetical protein CQ044_03240 [Microbacterium sp. MYb64]